MARRYDAIVIGTGQSEPSLAVDATAGRQVAVILDDICAGARASSERCISI